MLRTLLVVMSLTFSAAALAERAPAIPDYPADKVAPHTWVIHGPTEYPNPQNKGFMNNPAFVVTRAGVVVVDPGSSVQTGAMVLRQIAKVTDLPVVAVLNTHVHGDHWLGNHAIQEAYPEAAIYGHPRMIEQVGKGAGESWIDLMDRSTEGATRGTEVHGPTEAIGHGDRFAVGGFTFRFHHPGSAHTDNDLMIEVVEEKLLFLADNANNDRIVRMDDGTFSGTVAVLDYAMKNIDVEVLVPGHGPSATDWTFVKDYRDYMAELYATVEVLYDEGLAAFEMKDKVAEKLARFSEWNGYQDELGKHISLAVLEVEQKMFE